MWWHWKKQTTVQEYLHVVRSSEECNGWSLSRQEPLGATPGAAMAAVTQFSAHFAMCVCVCVCVWNFAYGVLYVPTAHSYIFAYSSMYN